MEKKPFISMANSNKEQGMFVNGADEEITLAHNREFRSCQSQILFLWKLIFVFCGGEHLFVYLEKI